MSMCPCTQCDKLEDTDYDTGEWINDKYICEDCISNMDEEELQELKTRGTWK